MQSSTASTAFLSPVGVRAPRAFYGARLAASPAVARPIRAGGRVVQRPRAVLDPGLVEHVPAAFAAAHAHLPGLFDLLGTGAGAVGSDVAHAANAAMTLIADATATVGQTAADAGAAAVEAKKNGWWDSFVNLIEVALVSLHDNLVAIGVPQAYGFTIILFTVIIKALTLPLNSAQMESTLKMQSISPRLKKIQTDYKDNPSVMNQMIAQMYKDEKINPLAGCVPALVQIPIWIALYRTVLNLAKENLLDERFLFLPSLQGPVSQTGASLSAWLYPFIDGAPPIGWHDAVCYLVLPVLLIVSQSISQKLLQPDTQDPSAAQANAVLKFMPLLVGWFSLNVPSGLGVYWFTNNVVSTLQTLFFRNKFKVKNPEVESSSANSTATSVNEVRPVKLEDKEGFVAKPKSSPSSGTKTKRRKRR